MSKTSFYGKCPIYSSLTLPLPDLSQPSALLCVYSFIQGMVDGSASQPVLRQDTGYMVEKTYYDIAPYLGAFGAYLMSQ